VVKNFHISLWCMGAGMNTHQNPVLEEIKSHITTLFEHDSPLGQSLWKALLQEHPADIAQFLSDIDKEYLAPLFVRLPKEIKVEVFKEFSDSTKVHLLSSMNEPELVEALTLLAADELTDVFDLLSDDDLKRYLDLLNKTARDQVISLLRFHPE